MKTPAVSSSLLVVGLMLFTPAEGTAQSNPRYIQFSPGAVKGAFYAPDAGPAPHVGILAIHRTSNFMGYLGCTELSKRGFLAKSKDKDFVVFEGATHGQTPCVPCERSPGQYSNTVKNCFDYVGAWINERF